MDCKVEAIWVKRRKNRLVGVSLFSRYGPDVLECERRREGEEEREFSGLEWWSRYFCLFLPIGVFGFLFLFFIFILDW